MGAVAKLEPLDDDVDHVRGEPGAPIILEYGDYECPYTRQAFRSIERVEQELSGRVRFAFRHFPLTQIHPHALARSLPASRATSRAARPPAWFAARRRCSSTASSTPAATRPRPWSRRSHPARDHPDPSERVDGFGAGG